MTRFFPTNWTPLTAAFLSLTGQNDDGDVDRYSNRSPRRYVDYYHLMFDAHEVILAEGVPAESFYPGDYIMQGDDLQDDVEALFPEMAETQGLDWQPAKRMLRGAEARMLQTERLLAA